MYELKTIPRNSSNNYYDEKDKIFYERRETTAEHVYSCLRLADYFLTTEPEFIDLDKLKVYEILLYHDDIEIITRDIGISQRKSRINKENQELEALPILYKKIPLELNKKLIMLDNEYREKHTQTSKFASGIDKMDALVHEIQYPNDWSPKGFNERTVREWFEPTFKYSSTFMNYFEKLVQQLDNNGYFHINPSGKKLEY